jgi:hypothetical protein
MVDLLLSIIALDWASSQVLAPGMDSIYAEKAASDTVEIQMFGLGPDPTASCLLKCQGS